MPDPVTLLEPCDLMYDMTWEETVQWLRNQPDQDWLVRDCYFDDPIGESAQRFVSSAEWQAISALLPARRGRALDLGAGRGIASYALVQSGWQVTAVEPDDSAIVGAQAIINLGRESKVAIAVVQAYGEDLPFRDHSFDLVYTRQVLHHAQNPFLFCREVSRVLKSGGKFIATREHVISRQADLPVFLVNHPLHKYFGGEHAYLLSDYRAALTKSGLHIRKLLGSFDSVVNYYPMAWAEVRRCCVELLARHVGAPLAFRLTSERRVWGRWMLGKLATRLSATNDTPGRFYSFIVEKE